MAKRSRQRANMKQTVVWIPIEDHEAFKRIQPAEGSWSWFVRECVKRYIDLHTEEPERLIDMVVGSIREDANGETEEA